MINNNSLYRSGCTPRVIFYSQSNKGHEYNYGNPVLSITGRSSRHITPNISKERKVFDYIKPHPQPDSNRTLIPNCGNFDTKTRPRKFKSKVYDSSMDNALCEINNKKQKSSIKINRKKNRTSSELLNDCKEEEKSMNYNSKENKNNNYSFCLKNKYDYNSGIINLPGSCKRQLDDISDDYQNKLPKKINMSSTASCFRERNLNSPEVSLALNAKKKICRTRSSPRTINAHKGNRNVGDLNKYSKLMHTSNDIFYNNNYYNDNKDKTINYSTNDKKNFVNNYMKEINFINNNINNNNFNLNNQYNTYEPTFKSIEGMNNFRRRNKSKIYEAKNRNKLNYDENNKENYVDDNKNKTENNNSLGFYQPISDNTLIPSYFDNIYREKKNGAVTHYIKKRNVISYNKLFNEVHQEQKQYSLMDYYGRYYSKKNYSQIELH